MDDYSQDQIDDALQTAASSDYYVNQEQQALDFQSIQQPSDQLAQLPQYQPPQPQYQTAQQSPQPQYQPVLQVQYQTAQQPPQPQYQPAQQPQYQPAYQPQPQYQPVHQPPQPQYQPPQQPWQYQQNQNPPQYQPEQKPSQFQQYQPVGSYTPRPQNQIIATEGWSTGLFGCLEDPTNALMTACCPCVTFGQIAEIIDNGHSSCATSGALYFGVWFCIAMPCLLSYSYRTKLRSKYNLIETPAPDCLTHCFCEPCALCQEYRELQHRGLDPSIGMQGNLALQQQRNYAMTPPINNSMKH